MPFYLELLRFESRKILAYKARATVGAMPTIEATPQNKFIFIFFDKHILNSMYLHYIEYFA